MNGALARPMEILATMPAALMLGLAHTVTRGPALTIVLVAGSSDTVVAALRLPARNALDTDSPIEGLLVSRRKNEGARH